MTREEAVIILDGFKSNPLFNSTHAQAFDMAISALSENKREWIPITTRIDESGEEILDCPLPDDGQEVLISYSGNVYIDTFWNDDLNYFEDFDIGDVDAWQPLPEPYKKGAS